VAALVPMWLLGRAPHLATGPGPGATAVVPVRVHTPWLWQATVGDAPDGPAVLLFFTNRTRWLEETGVVVSRDGGYRMVPMTIGESQGLLTPDGRAYVRGGPEPLDLSTGETRRADGRPWHVAPLAWAPDGRRLLAAQSNDLDVITYGDDGQPVEEPAKPDDLYEVDPATGQRRLIAKGLFDVILGGAWSPDDGLVAVVGGPDVGPATLAVLDAATGARRWSVPLAEGERLAGREAWTPDGTRIALLADDRVVYADAADGRRLAGGSSMDGSPRELLGWNDGEPVFAVDRGGHVDLCVLHADGREQTLVRTPAGTSGVDVPRDLIQAGAFGAPDTYPSPWSAPGWLYAIVIVPVVVILTRLWRRRRSSDSVRRSEGE
jgi:hypothetical protein